MSSDYPATAMENNLENPLLSSPRHSNFSIFIIIRDAIYELLILLILLLLFTVVIMFLTMAIAILFQFFQAPKSQTNSVFVSSFNVSTNSSDTNWDAKLSLNHPGGNLKDFDVTYEAQAWLYFRNGFVSRTRISSPSMYYSFQGQELHVHANFTMQAETDQEDFTRDRAVILDLLVEANATHKPNTYESYLEFGTFLMIGCNDLKIEFSLNQSLGTLSGGAKSCQFEMCPAKSDALYGRANRCSNLPINAV